MLNNKVFYLNHGSNLRSNFTSNETENISFVSSCETPQTFNSFEEFSVCYVYFASRKPLATFLEINLAAGAVFFNALVFFCCFVGSKKKTCFDKILFGYCLVDGITGLIDIPLFHCNDIFGYWPFGDVVIRLWSTYDNNINVNTSAHMFYASYARYRSMKNPKGFEREKLLMHPYYIMAFIWVFSLGLWGIIVNCFGIIPYTNSVNFDPYYLMFILNFFPWFTLLVLIFIIAIMIYVFLHQKAQRQKKKKIKRPAKNQVSTINTQASQTLNTAITQTSATTGSKLLSTYSPFAKIKRHLKRFRLPAEKKFLIIMGSYWFQWTPPCIVVLLSTFVYIPTNINLAIYWLTYTVCLTDPICVLTLNPNITFPSWKEIKETFKIRR